MKKEVLYRIHLISFLLFVLAVVALVYNYFTFCSPEECTIAAFLARNEVILGVLLLATLFYVLHFLRSGLIGFIIFVACFIAGYSVGGVKLLILQIASFLFLSVIGVLILKLFFLSRS